MKRKYEAIIALKTRGTEESVEKTISHLGREIESEGARLEQIDQIGRRNVAFPGPQKMVEAFYVNFHFEAAPALIEKLRAKFALNHDIYLQNYLVRA
jgi:small subunit ribosomal protein S6